METQMSRRHEVLEAIAITIGALMVMAALATVVSLEYLP
jgi:hypothetical protein